MSETHSAAPKRSNWVAITTGVIGGVLLLGAASTAAVAGVFTANIDPNVVPQLIRLSVGPDHRLLLPLSALGGAMLLVGADIVARRIVVPAELPIGIVTATIGAPFFLRLLLRRSSLIDV